MPGASMFRAWEMFEDEMDGTAFYIPEDDMGSLMMVSKAKTAPDIYGESRGPEGVPERTDAHSVEITPDV